MSAERKPGQRWRFVFDGEIGTGGYFYGANVCFTPRQIEYATSSERLPDPEPDSQIDDIYAWQIDDICADAEQERWRRVTGVMWVAYPYDTSRPARHDSQMARPLKPVMLGGRHVSELDES